MFDFYDYIDEKVKDLLEKNPSLSNDEIIDEVLNGITLKDLVLNCGSLTADKAISEISGTILRYRKNNAVVDVTERLLSSYVIKEDYNMVYNNTDQQWVQINGVNGYKLTGKNGNYIFLPAAGYGSGNSVL